MVPALCSFASYAVLTALVAALTRFNHGIALIWLANGPLLAALCLMPPKRWPLLAVSAALGAIAAIAAFITVNVAVVPVAAIDVGEALIAAALLRYWGVSSVLFRSIRTVPMFVMACLCAVIVCGMPGAAIASYMRHLSFAAVWSDWIIGHGLGLLIVTPLALVLLGRDTEWADLLRPYQLLRAAGVLLLVAATAFMTFWQSALPLLFLPVLPVVIATFALQRIGAAASVVIVAVIGGVLTLHGHGPVMLVKAGAGAQLQFFHFYLAALFVTALPIAAMLVQREELMRALGENEARYRLLADNATDIMVTLDPDMTVRFVSPSVREIALYQPDMLVGMNALDLVYDDDRERVRATYHEGLAAPERTYAMEFRAIKADGAVSWFEANTRVVTGSGGKPTAIVCIIRDTGRRKRREAELERAATTDPLTGLLNRNAFRRRIEERLRGDGPPGTLALVDLDHFKMVNDVYGHASGDAALLVLADLLRANLRGDDAVGRIGGEEFAILFSGHTPSAAVAICDRLRDILANTEIPTADDMFSITMSAGVMPIRRDLPIDALFSRADEALYRAKALGRNRTERAVG